MVGAFGTLGLVIRALEQAPAGQKPDLRLAKRVLLFTLVVSSGLYLLYVLFGESWLGWFLRWR